MHATDARESPIRSGKLRSSRPRPRRGARIALLALASLNALGALAPASPSAALRGQRSAHPTADRSAPPNVVFILADDLGYGELGCYGQRKIRTPHIDRLAREGLRFTQAYSGAPVCAPARCVLLTGRSSPRAEIRGNKPQPPEGQAPIGEAGTSLAELFRAAGHATAAFGKWGLGPVGSTGDPAHQGFDLFFGYNCQREAHSYFPGHLWRNDERVPLNGGEGRPGHAKLGPGEAVDASRYRGADYAPDRLLAEALRFLDEHRERPFFLYLPFVEPHVAMQPPPAWVDAYPREWDEAPYRGQKGYLPHPRPRAGYAAMISDLDEHVGAILERLETLGLVDDTLVVFTSDNGATHDVGGVDTSFFESVGALRGRKGSVYEGGLRVPSIVRWPGRVAAGATSDLPTSFQDWAPTFATLLGAERAPEWDGLDLVPELVGEGELAPRPFLGWEFHGYGGQKAVRMGDWKAVLQRIHAGGDAIELYDLASDPSEARDVADQHPELVERARHFFAEERTPNAVFPMKAFD